MLLLHGVRFQSLFGDLRSHMPCDTAKGGKKRDQVFVHSIFNLQIPFTYMVSLSHRIKTTLYGCVHVCLVTWSCPARGDPMDCSPLGSSVHGDSPGKNTGVGCHALLQGIFPTQELNPGLPGNLYCRQLLYQQLLGKLDD